MPNSAKLNLGKKGEQLAARYLQQKGYKILDFNYRTKFGEIDVVAKDGETIVFVEVKTRTSTRFGEPEEAVGKRKLAHIKRAAESFCIANSYNGQTRLEVVAIIKNQDSIAIRNVAVD